MLNMIWIFDFKYIKLKNNSAGLYRFLTNARICVRRGYLFYIHIIPDVIFRIFHTFFVT